MARPWLSVVMPTYNGAAYLVAALDSIAVQRDDDIEVIAVDDGSTDATRAVLEGYAGRLPLRIVARPRVGNWVANTNHGLDLARGEYVGFLHQDDCWLPGRLPALKRRLADAPDAVLVVHASWFIDAAGRRLGVWRCPLPATAVGLPPTTVIDRLLVQNFIAVPAAVFRRDAALRAGRLDESLWYTADWDWWLRLAAGGTTLYCPRPLTALRVHAASQTAVRTTWADELRRQLETVLERHLQGLAGSTRRVARPESSKGVGDSTPFEDSGRATQGAALTSRDSVATWPRAGRDVEATSRTARFAVEVNLALAALAHRQRPDWRRLAGALRTMGLSGWPRFLRDSRLVERVGARLRLGVHTRRPQTRPILAKGGGRFSTCRISWAGCEPAATEGRSQTCRHRP
jgi:GT2 family glycosyltransferase